MNKMNCYLRGVDDVKNNTDIVLSLQVSLTSARVNVKRRHYWSLFYEYAPIYQ